jgi:hypothetical protein
MVQRLIISEDIKDDSYFNYFLSQKILKMFMNQIFPLKVSVIISSFESHIMFSFNKPHTIKMCFNY